MEKNNHAALPTLEMVLLAFQKGVARASQATNDASKHDPNFLTGKRTLYAIDSLDVELSAGIEMFRDPQGEFEDGVRIDFSAPGESRSRLKFTVEPKPLEPISGARVMLSRLDPLKTGGNVNQFLVWFIDENGDLKPGVKLAIMFTPLDRKDQKLRVFTRADHTGHLRFLIESNGTYQSKAIFEPSGFKLDMDHDWVVSVRKKATQKPVSIELPIIKSLSQK